jgi:chromosome segregation ATPase
MSSSGANAQVERKLRKVSEQLVSLRDDMRVTEEHLRQLSDEEDDARIRALVSETPVAEKEHRKASRHADRLRSSREKALAKIAELERLQDELLDRLTAST